MTPLPDPDFDPAEEPPWEPDGGKFALVSEPAGSILLPEEFWTARPVLTHIRNAAHGRARSADVVFHAVLTRIAGAIPHTVKLPAIVGSQAPLCYFAAAVGPPGSGKSSATAIAAELVPVDAHVADNLPAGSGEGLVEVLFDWVKELDEKDKTVTVKRQTKFNAIVCIDEGEALATLGSRNGSTTLATLRSIWSGQALGQTNATTERKRLVPPGQYTYGLVLGLQPALAGALLDDVVAGTPQRFGWAWAIDPSIPDEAPAWPGPLAWDGPTPNSLHEISQRPATGFVSHELIVSPAISAEIRRKGLAATRGEVEIDPHDAHGDLLRLKVAALLAILDGRLDVNDDDWTLAEIVTTTSIAVRMHVQAIVTEEARKRERQTSERLALRAVTATTAVELDAVERTARRIVVILRSNGGEMSVSGVRHRCSRPQRDHLQAGIAYGVNFGWFEEFTVPGQRGDVQMLRLEEAA